jgi:hypothetical protein
VCVCVRVCVLNGATCLYPIITVRYHHSGNFLTPRHIRLPWISIEDDAKQIRRLNTEYRTARTCSSPPLPTGLNILYVLARHIYNYSVLQELPFGCGAHQLNTIIVNALPYSTSIHLILRVI